MPEVRSGGRCWHQALAYALAGRRWEELGEQDQPDPAGLADQLRRLTPGGRWDALGEAAGTVPADLMTGLGHAQFAAALGELRRLLGTPAPAVVAAAAPETTRASAAERRLLDEVPPHHGS